jgi:hypothetical protein
MNLGERTDEERKDQSDEDWFPERMELVKGLIDEYIEFLKHEPREFLRTHRFDELRRDYKKYFLGNIDKLAMDNSRIRFWGKYIKKDPWYVSYKMAW